ncbi:MULTISPECIES: hypothetical protein [Citrobacter]|nr:MULTISPECIES: hypothetical protein [Citrobacter]
MAKELKNSPPAEVEKKPEQVLQKSVLKQLRQRQRQKSKENPDQ